MDAEHDIVIELFETSISESEASEVVAEMRAEFAERVEALEDVSSKDGSRGFASVGTRTDRKEQLHVVLHRGGAIAQVTFTYPASSRPIVSPIAKSLSVDTGARLDPARLYGLEVGRAEGLGVDENISMVLVHETSRTPPLPPGSPTVDFTIVYHDPRDGDVTLDSLPSLLGDDIDRSTVKTAAVTFDGSTAVELVGETVDRGVRIRQISVFAVERGTILHVRGHCSLKDDLDRLRKVIYGTRRVALPPGAVPLPSAEVGRRAGGSRSGQ